MSSWMEYQAKLNEKYMPVLFCISSFEATSYKKLHDIGERAERWSEWRKTFRITVNFSSNKMHPRSALRITLPKM